MEITEQINEFKDFIEGHYRDILMENHRTGNNYLEIDYTKLSRFSIDLAQSMIDLPKETFEAFKIAAKEILDLKKENVFEVRAKNIHENLSIPIRNIRSHHINRFVVTDGHVKNRTNVKPRIKSARFECPSCGNIITLLQFDKNFREPKSCNCGRKNKFTSISKEMIDIQMLSLEEPFENLGEDTVPQRLAILLKHDLTDNARQKQYLPGKPIKISGILKEMPIYTKGGKSVDVDWILEANYCESLEDDLTKTNFTPGEIKEFEELSKTPDIFQKLVRSVAPDLKEIDKVKEAVLLYLAKGTPKQSKEGKRAREFFSILLIGDPSGGKSQVGNEVKLLSWRCKKAVGASASGVGLTASAEKDETLNMRVLSAGPLVLCNEGHIVIDEFDKMDKEVTSHLHESMEDGTINIDKSQVHGTLKARTPVFMIGNPKLGSFDNFEPISKQIGLPTPLISRFDLIFPIRDIPDKAKDETIADAILNKHIDIDDINEREIPLQLLKNYICYVSLNIKPKLSDEARDEIKRFFLGVRSQSIQNGTIGIKHRHLEGLIRMAEASAKLHMRDEVTVWDARKAIELMTLSLTAFGLDKDTGIVDVDKIYTGISSSQRNKIGIIKKIIEAFDDGRRKKILVDEIIMNASNEGIDEDKTVEIITKLKRTGDIICVDKKHIQKI